MPSTPLSEIESRIAKLQEKLASAGLEGAILLQRADLFYFSGTGQDATLFVPVEGEALLMARKSYERAVEDTPLSSVARVRKLTEVGDHISSYVSEKPRVIGMELDVIPVNVFRFYEAIFEGAEIRDISPMVREIRSVKSPYEVELIRRAGRMNDKVFEEIPNILKEGMTELEFSGLVEAEYRRLGHQGVIRIRAFNQDIFYGHIMSGANLAMPSVSVGPTGGRGVNASVPQGASDKPIARNEPIQIDYVSAVEGYVVDQARTFFIGEAPEKFLRIHEVAVSIQNRIAEEGKAGAVAGSLYETAIAMARDAGLEEGFMGYPDPVPFVGHGIGLELDELPLVGRRSKTLLEEGMVVAVEPKFIIPGKGLAGIENSFVITDKGMQRISALADEIKIVE